MTNKICTISIGENSMDNDYTFYDNGSVERSFDDDHYRRINRKDYLVAKELSEAIKKKIIANCPVEYKDQILAILRK